MRYKIFICLLLLIFGKTSFSQDTTEVKPDWVVLSKDAKAAYFIKSDYVKKDEDGIKRAYAMVIENTSSGELRTIFDSHISSESTVKTDKWTGYSPLKKEWDIEQEKSRGGENFELMNRFVMGLKGWCRGIYHRVTGIYLQAYLDEYCYRFNRSLFKETAFDKLIQRMVMEDPLQYKTLRINNLN